MISDTLTWSPYAKLPTVPAAFPLQTDRACPLSGARNETELFRIDDFQFFNDCGGQNRITHRVVFNPQSGMLYTNPCYTPEGFTMLFEKAGQSYGHSEGRMEEQVDWIHAHCPSVTSVCDIGCGHGSFLKALPEGTQKIGVDIDAASIEKARTLSPDSRFVCQDFETFTLDEPVDLLTMFHVLEHLPHPLETLQNLRRLARPETRLIVEVPILERANENQDLVGFFTVQHLTHFSRDTLIAMLDRAGWSVESVTMMDGYNGCRVLCQPGDPKTTELTEPQKAAVRELADSYLAGWRQRVAAINNRIKDIPDNDRILIWGAGQHTEYLARLTPLFSSKPQYLLVDKDPLKDRTVYHGIPVMAPDRIAPEEWRQSDFHVVISSYGWQEAIRDELLSKGVDENRITCLYDSVQRY